MSTNTTEKAFQNKVCDYLESTGYIRRSTNNYQKDICLDAELVLKFIESTQPKGWEFFQTRFDDPKVKFIQSLKRDIASKGVIEVLRNGFREAGVDFTLFYSRPYNKLNPDLEEKFNQNIYSVIDELEYEERENGNRLDLVIFINGIPISTIELKDTFSQGVEKAIKQYKEDRNSKENIFKRTLIHFAMSDEKIYMTTKLEGDKTNFLPFNKGITNPVIPDNYKTSYLYTEILQPVQLSKLIHNFIFMEGDKPIFPRFHQLDCVNQLLANPTPGNNYLVQHSAGSGKTKTIAWLAHGLLNKFDEKDDRIYDMVIVISDRKVIDGQLQEQVKAIEKKEGVVETIKNNSKELAEAIKSGTCIVVTTLHKFSYIIDKIKDIPNRSYAIIVDEAHSSQTGAHARNLRTGLSNSQPEDILLSLSDDEIDKQILKEIEKARDTSNLSFFGFTATPKNKTLELFGYEDAEGHFGSHHLYSMKQAISEGFILDVLKNYITYPTYFKLIKKIENDPIIDKNKTKRLLRKFVEQHPHSIEKKTDIMLTHYMNSTYYKIKKHIKDDIGQARAMVVTSSRKDAVLYKLEFDKQIKEKNLPIKTLVAFTGTVKHNNINYTENNMNSLENQSIVDAFNEEPYRILIVADKFQTGFDEPLLHTMFVDKSLRDVKAVQTLNRLNRMYPNKKDTLVLDFANKKEDIQEAFHPYFQETSLVESTDYRILYDLMNELFDKFLFTRDNVEEFVKAFKSNKAQSTLHNMLNMPVEKFNNLDKDNKSEFKRILSKYQSMYSFLSQLIPFSDLLLEKVFIYNKFLNKKLPTINEPLPKSILDDVDIDSYKIDTKDKGTSVTLIHEEGELFPTGGNTTFNPDEKDRLSKIIEDLNDTYNTDFSEEDSLLLKQIKDGLISNEDLEKRIKNPGNSRDNVSAVFDRYFEEELRGLFRKNVTFFKKINDNHELKTSMKEHLLNLLYEEQKK